MASINKVILIGNLGRDPESRSLPSGEQVTTLSIATTEVRKDRQTGQRIENTEWHRISFFGRMAEVAKQYLQKGSQIYVEGRLRTRKYTGKDGIERYTTDILGEQLQMLGKRKGDGLTGGTKTDGNQTDTDDSWKYDPKLDDIPF